jgi:hypothetical protein
MNKSEFLANLQTERTRWEAFLSQVPEGQMINPAIDGWSVKDIIAHLTWHEREMIGVIQARALVGSELWNVALAERNAAIFEQNRLRSLAEVCAEAEQVYAQFLECLETLTDEDLNDSSRFAEMPADWIPWELIASNCYEHYRDHSRDLQSWLEKRLHETGQ